MQTKTDIIKKSKRCRIDKRNLIKKEAKNASVKSTLMKPL